MPVVCKKEGVSEKQMDAAQEARLLTAAEEAARIVAEADCVLFMSGAGMGVDSGIGTFRGANAGKWPPLEERNMDFTQMSTPSWFEEDGDPHLAFGFWYWRFQGYTEAKPHEVCVDCAWMGRGGHAWTCELPRPACGLSWAIC